MNETHIAPTTPPTRAERSSYMAVFAITLSLLAIAVSGYALEKMRSAPPPAAPVVRAVADGDNEKLASLERSLDEARGEIAALHTKLGEIPPQGDDETAEVKETVEAVKSELATSQEAIAQDIARLDAKIVTLSTPEQRANIRLSYDLLRERVESGEPYTAELEKLKQAMSDAPQEKDFFVLEEHAADGVKTVAALYNAIGSVRIDTPQIEKPDAATTGTWREKTLQSFKSLVKVERLGDGPSPFATLHEIETLMKFGDVRETREAISRLPANDQRAFEEWLDAAEARLEVMEALHALGARALEQPATPVPEKAAEADTTTPDAVKE